MLLLRLKPALAHMRPSIWSNIALCHLNLDEIRQGAGGD